jgi:hypothetical protein
MKTKPNHRDSGIAYRDIAPTAQDKEVEPNVHYRNQRDEIHSANPEIRQEQDE